MTLYINTADKQLISVALKIDGKVVETLSEDNEFGSQVLLPLIEKILKKQKLDYQNLEAIEVETGPGSFTGLRVGISIANALGFSLGIPVNGKQLETAVLY